MKSIARIALGLAATLGAGGALQAAPHDTARQVKVSYADLNLAQPQDVQTLYRRLQHAAAHVCGDQDRWNLMRYQAWQRCYDQALQGAVQQVPAPQLLAYHVDHRLPRLS